YRDCLSRDQSLTVTLPRDNLHDVFFRHAKILHLTGFYPAINPDNIAVYERAIELAKKHGLKISFDPNIRLRMWSREKAREVLSRFLPNVDILLAEIGRAHV